MVQAPTGAGKTVLAASIVTRALAKGNRVLFVMPLVEQTVAAFNVQGIDAVGVLQGYHWMELSRDSPPQGTLVGAALLALRRLVANVSLDNRQP